MRARPNTRVMHDTQDRISEQEKKDRARKNLPGEMATHPEKLWISLWINGDKLCVSAPYTYYEALSTCALRAQLLDYKFIINFKH